MSRRDPLGLFDPSFGGLVPASGVAEALSIQQQMPKMIGPTWNSPYLPDYVSLQFDFYVFSGGFTYTRYGDLYQGKGVSRGYPRPSIMGFSMTGGYAVPFQSCPNENPRESLHGIVNGWSAAGGYFDLVGGSVTGNLSGFAAQVGVGAGGGGVSPGMINQYVGNAALLPPLQP
jgi:hypothetical protein